ncbi:hypothetical protein ABZ639_05675 [Saccharomonospora sp. NPDC006951]
MRTLMHGDAWVHYGQIYVQSARPGAPETTMEDSFRGQRNGLCGAAVPGVLFLITGLHTGRVGFTVEHHDAAPAAPEGWQEVVEVAFRLDGDAIALAGWGGEGHWPLDLPRGDYRVRYCGSGMDEARRADTRMEGDPEIDRYLVQFWPAPASADAVVRCTSAIARYWHGYAAGLPPAPNAEPDAAALRQEHAHRHERERTPSAWWPAGPPGGHSPRRG